MLAVIVSTTMASEMELFGRLTDPVASKLVVVTFVEVKFVPVKLVITPVVAMNDVAKRLVEVALVKIPAAGVTRPIGVLLMVPASMVRPSITNASEIELVGRVICPVALKLVVVMFVATTFVGLKVVTTRFEKNPFVEVSEVPFAVPNERLVELKV